MTLWKTRDGEELEIRDMHDEHLVNAIRRLDRMKLAADLRLLQSSREFGNWMDANDDSGDVLALEGPEEAFPLYADLIREADLRWWLDGVQQHVEAFRERERRGFVEEGVRP